MKTTFLRSATLAAFATATLLAVGTALPIHAAPDEREGMAEHAQHRHAWLKSRLDQAAQRLEIRASQMPAWAALSEAMLALPADRPGALTTAAGAGAIAQGMADRAAAHAAHAAAVATATLALEEVLDPNQRKLLDQMAQRFASEHHRCHGRAAKQDWHHEGRDLRGEHPGEAREPSGKAH